MANALFDADAFWQFSGELYQKKGVKELCLQCQDEFSLNVNLLLFCGWLWRFDISLTIPQWRIVQQVITQSESELHELRKQRKCQVKNSKQYKACLERELQLEAQQQNLILQTAEGLNLQEVNEHPLRSYFAYTACGGDHLLETLISVFDEDNEEASI